MILCDTNIFISAFNKRTEAIDKMQEIGFDKKMTRVLRENPDIFMLSGRGTMRFDEIAEIYSSSRGTESNFSKSLSSSIWKNLPLINFIKLIEAKLHELSSTCIYSEQGLDAFIGAVFGVVCHLLIVS
jgi:hypothetical protein